jgi:hypothetical protein
MRSLDIQQAHKGIRIPQVGGFFNGGFFCILARYSDFQNINPSLRGCKSVVAQNFVPVHII